MITWMQTHRKYLVPTIWISTIAFVGAGFVGWGAYDYGKNKSDTVALVGEKVVSVSELQSSYSKLFSYYNQVFGGTLTQEKATQLNLQGIALEQLTNQALLLNYANELGIKALDSEVIDQYTSIKAFQENGVFNKDTYEKVLRAQGLDKKSFEKELEKSVILKKMQAILTLPATELEEEVTFSASSLADHLLIKKITQDLSAITIGEEELKKAWEDSKNDYMSLISYQLETIKVPASDITVTDTQVTEFYNEKKFKFKDSDGKILSFEKAKDAVTKATQLKGAKTAVLKKYLAFKKGEISADNVIKVDATSSDFPFQELKDKQDGSYLKAIALEDGYMTARVKSITQPQPLSFEDAKEKVEKRLRQAKANVLLEEKAKAQSGALSDGKDLGFITMKDSDKLEGINPQEASQFLRYVFSKDDKKGYFISGNSAIVYNIKEQKLFDAEKFTAQKEAIAKEVAKMKENALERGLVKELKKRYTIQTFLKEG